MFAIECKRPDETSGLEQLDTYLGREPHLRLGIWANSADPSAPAVFLFKDEKDRTHPQKRTVSHLPKPDSKLDRDYKALTGDGLVVPSKDVLTKTLQDLLDRVVAGDAKVTRREEQLDQLCNVILVKLASDKDAKLAPKREVALRPAATAEKTADAVKRQFKDLVDTYPDTFPGEGDRALRFSDDTLALCVDELAPLNLLRVGPEVLSVAFQVLRSAALKQKEGQYFTPQPVIAAAVRAVDVSSARRILDPACGTGGFLVETMVAKREAVEAAGGDTDQLVSWAQLALFGIDKDPIAVKLTKAVMQIMGDGSAQCSRGDSVATHRWPTEYAYLQTDYKDGSFHLILTNPPFGAPLKIKRSEARKAGLSITDGLAAGKDLELGLAMLDRCHKFLREGGHLCIVLPETYFFSPSYRFVRDWCRTRFAPEVVINVAMEAFAGFCRAKTNVYVFRKLKSFDGVRGAAERAALFSEQQEAVNKERVIMLNPRTCGVYKNGSIRYQVDEHGERTAKIDNEMLDHVLAWKSGEMPPRAVEVSIGETVARDVLVPTYYDSRRNVAFDALKARLGCGEVTLGELVDRGLVELRGGHGSVSNDQRVGGVPYVKVSDIRALRVNVNPTNMIPLALARKKWGYADHSGLQPWDLITPKPGQQQHRRVRYATSWRGEDCSYQGNVRRPCAGGGVQATRPVLPNVGLLAPCGARPMEARDAHAD